MINIISLLAAYIFMEFVAYFSHKYIMHGFLRRWHVGHHINDLKRPDEEVQNNGFEQNDLFFLIFAIPAIIIMIVGLLTGIWILVYISAGITLYGITYFLIHDVIYHKRISVPFLQRNHGRYMRAILRAHHAHHKPKNKTDFESYGLLLFPKRHLKEA